jgi:hypothetical protein
MLFSPYFIAYRVSYRINEGAWPKNVNADHHKGLFGVSMFLLMPVLIGVFAVYPKNPELSNGRILLFTIIALFAGNHFFLISKHRQRNFDEWFDKQDVKIKLICYAAFGICLAADVTGLMLLHNRAIPVRTQPATDTAYDIP